jgi:hypothetical protein
MNTHDELRSKPDYESDPVEQLAFELAFELEDAVSASPVPQNGEGGE